MKKKSALVILLILVALLLIYSSEIIIYLGLKSEIVNTKGIALPENSNVEEIMINNENSCSYSSPLLSSKVFAFASDNEAEEALKHIMKFTGLPTNFLLAASDVDNAAAVINNNKRYILYNQSFMNEVLLRTNTKFGALSILAHEVGHHLAGHTLNMSETRHQLELEADRFSGFISFKMGATLQEACIAMETYGTSQTSTHPSKKSRITAIVNGWMEAEEEIKSSTTSISEIKIPVETNAIYQVAIVGENSALTIRNRSLSLAEFRLGNSGTKEGDDLNEATTITFLPNGTEIEILSSINRTYYVKAKTSSGDIFGYVVKGYANQPTLKKKVEVQIKKAN